MKQSERPGKRKEESKRGRKWRKVGGRKEGKERKRKEEREGGRKAWDLLRYF